MAQVLVIEDERDIRDVLEYNLRQAGYDVQVAPTGGEGLRLAHERAPELVLLDLMLPDMHGTDVCRSLKQDVATRDARIVMVTAKGEEIDRVVGFELGADDYVVKPFSVRELLLRIQAVLRHAPSNDVPASSSQGTVFGVLRIDQDAHRVWVNAQELELTALEYKLLVTLLERKNRVQSREVLLTDVWGVQSDIATRTVDTHVKRLREKLGDEACDYIQTVRGVGYRFVAHPDEAKR